MFKYATLNWPVGYQLLKKCCMFLGDRYEEDPVVRRRNLDEIDDWGGGRKSIADEAMDKVKDLWNRAHGRPKQGSPCDMRFVTFFLLILLNSAMVSPVV